MTIDQKVELIRFPKEGNIKVVQIYLDNQPFLLCGKENRFYHAEILENFLICKEVEYTSSPLPGKNYNVADLEGERYKVVGMGYAKVMVTNPPSMRLPYAGSGDYKIDADEEFNELIKKTLEGWKFIG